MNPRERLEAIYRVALQSVDAGAAVRRALSRDSLPESLVVLALGKAACAMAAAVEESAGARIRAGLAVTKDGYAQDLQRIRVREAAHPVPDVRCEGAAREALALVRAARRDDTLLVLLSGGTSALTACPAPGLDLADLAATTRALLASGADIGEMNAVRKHLSAFSGGRLAQASACDAIQVLAVSDVPGDALDVLGSGPCAPDPTRYDDALELLAKSDIEDAVPQRVREHLARGAAGDIPETPGPDDPVFDRVRHDVIARNADARRAALAAAEGHGLRGVDLGEVLAGEAREQAASMVAQARALRGERPACLVAGGETTVTLMGPGLGGRSQELALAAATLLAEGGDQDIAVLAVGTDGTDGPTDAAGAFADAGTVARAAAQGVDAATALAANDSYGFFKREGGLVITGPTRTNVMDLVLICCERR